MSTNEKDIIHNWLNTPHENTHFLILATEEIKGFNADLDCVLKNI